MRRRRALTGEELALWAGVARSAVPLPGKRPPPIPPPPAAAAADRPGALAAPAPAAAPPAVPFPGGLAARLRTAPPAPAMHPIERPVHRKIARGRLPLDGRIDLHGRTAAAAHEALLGFLAGAQALGHRHVLVITGRGASFGSSGTLRRALPHWFATAPFRLLVAGFEPAAREHGGAGAFYVRMRR